MARRLTLVVTKGACSKIVRSTRTRSIRGRKPSGPGTQTRASCGDRPRRRYKGDDVYDPVTFFACVFGLVVAFIVAGGPFPEEKDDVPVVPHAGDRSEPVGEISKQVCKSRPQI